MQAILRRLEICGDFVITIFSEETIVEKPIEEWPVVDCLIAFTSSGFPLEKCKAYCKLVNPILVNSVDAQYVLQSRVAVYKTLSEWGIPCPEHVIVDHDTDTANDLVENENYIIYKGKKITKPFVEKPQDGDRHDIWIYYPLSIGGGVKKLFRKVKDRSSEFDANRNTIRRDGVYIYEPFLPTQGTDIKVYTVGAGYVHAEARKAPTVDGKVQRSKDGKEVRYPVVLTQAEKAISALIVKAFRQNICGFDILRTDGGSYVCDVNGWSFVKGNQKYYNDCSTLIRQRLLEEKGVASLDIGSMMILGPGDEVIKDASPAWLPEEALRESNESRTCKERLRSVLVVMRHGDRRPKEKMKFKSKQPALLAYFDNDDDGVAEIKLKSPEEMLTLKESMEKTVRELHSQLDARGLPGDSDESASEIATDVNNLELLIEMLAMEDRFSGLERKVQLKASKWKQPKDGPRKVSQVLVVAKWGGELTISGLSQAENLGRALRLNLYPNDPTGLLRLHSSFRHDFKIYSSQEGRCQITAAAFTKGFLDLEGDITPILVSLVSSDSFAQALLDEPIPKKERDEVKQKIESLLMSLKDITSEDMLALACPTEHAGLREAARRIGCPMQSLSRVSQLVAEYIDSIAAATAAAYEEFRQSQGDVTNEDHHDDATDDAVPLGKQTASCMSMGTGVWSIPTELKDAHKRQWLHLKRKEHRWRKLYHGFVQTKEAPSEGQEGEQISYDMSKIPDVWDNLYYDMLCHRNYLGDVSCKIAETMVELLQPLNEWVCLSEYGISQEEKLRIGTDVTWRLIGKILIDLEFMIDVDGGHLDEAGRRKEKEQEEESVSSDPYCSASGVAMAASQTSDVPSSIGGKEEVSSGAFGPELSAARPRRSSDPSVAVVALPEESMKVTAGAFDDMDLTPSHVGERSDPNGEAQGRDDDNESWRQASWNEWTHTPEDAGDRSRKHADEAPSSAAGVPRVRSGEHVKVEHSFALPAEKADPKQALPSETPAAPSMKKERTGKSRLAKLTPSLRNELRHALRDSSDWHPRLNEEVAKLTDIRNTQIVRSRIYVTSASTMHSLFNILRHGHSVIGEPNFVSGLDNIMDLNYLTHIVFRCYEVDDTSDSPPFDPPPRGARQEGPQNAQETEKSRYRVEVAVSPGVQVFRGGPHGSPVLWPTGPELCESCCHVAPLFIAASSVDLNRIERLLQGVLSKYGGQKPDEEEEEEKQSDCN